MIQYDDGIPFINDDEDETNPPPSPAPFNYPSKPKSSSSMQYDYNHPPPVPLVEPEEFNLEDVLLNCPHCHKSFYTTTRFPYPLQFQEPNFFKGSANGVRYSESIQNLKGLFGGTDKRRRFARICGFIVLLLLVFLLFNYLQSTGLKDGRGHLRGHSSTTSDGDEEGSWVKGDESQFLKMKRLPQCIIIGARKCGTRALIDMLNLHPQVEKAAIEVHFFDRDENYGKGLDWYRNHMPETTQDQLSIEKSPSYFVTPEVPERVQGMNSSIKLFLIVREPVTRVISDYTQIYGTNSKGHNMSKTPRLEELVLHPDGSINVHYKAIRISLYSRYLQRWLDVFPPSQIHVIDGDELIRDPYSQLREAEKFLGLQPRLQRDNFYFNATKGFYCWRKLEEVMEGQGINGTSMTTRDVSLHCLNDSKGRPHPVVERGIVSKLRRFYHPHNLRFYDMVGRDFGWPEK